jgi:hypothetical protein
MTDISGQIIERKNLKITDGFLSIAGLTHEKDRALLVSSHFERDAFAVRTADGEGKDFIVVSKEKHGFSRCVVCSVSENGCVKLRDYYEKLACYKDYLDSFVSLVLSPDTGVPVLRIFRMRLSGVTELMRLSEEGGAGRRFSFPLKTAMQKISSVAGRLDGGFASRITHDGIADEVTVNAPEGFFKLMLSVCAMFVRCSVSGEVKTKAISQSEEKTVKLCISCYGKLDSEMYIDALARAFERTKIPCAFNHGDGRMSFECELKAAAKRAEIVSDSAEFELAVDKMLSDESVLDLYRTVADITETYSEKYN